jgi:hypothetical protein
MYFYSLTAQRCLSQHFLDDALSRKQASNSQSAGWPDQKYAVLLLVGLE